ncbi:ABC transporter substrate-binding protein [Microvirga lotononidis]|uniref:ABC-type Fe3+ transport system, periplasmic component n=1 Tax=Microvirga lotononidis TaxID=864069 RepID=I4YN77_9HYPH|nr:ABC transporter substrate-binding protein [Microvirga lotononidis]EIM25419.1 ABC-type Fe3+ transport system, periplasmic component [Microvirga lotononidis]WQO27287.1 ABC transporter substrate-binding protein [Microvirga lotononidis]
MSRRKRPPRRPLTQWFCLLWAAVQPLTCLAQGVPTPVFPALQDEREVLSIHAATDRPAMEPLIRDFQLLNPHTRIEFVEYVTNDLFAAASKACQEGRVLGDVLLSSGVDQLVKLANDGCAGSIRSLETQMVPRWANWRDEVFGFTFEPVVFVYNKDRVPAEDVPKTHLELADLLRLKPDTYQGRVGTYDIRQSGIGYLLAFNDSQQTTTTYGRLLESLGRAETVVRCCTGEILDGIEAGRILIGYNMLASYAYARVRAGAKLGLVMPADYTLVLSRGAMIPIKAGNAAAGARFVNYLLSDRGQAVAQREAFFFGFAGEAPAGIEGAASIVRAGIARPIAIGPALLAVQDDERRRRFFADWSRSLVDMPTR